MRALLLDLRKNAGGELDSCVETASEFIGEGPVVYIQERGESRKARNAAGGNKRIDIPTAVLIDEGSASAAEILAGAIQDDKLGTLVGVNTFGKGLVQTVFPLEGGGALALTTARYLTPKLRDIERKGISPDIEVKEPSSPTPGGQVREPIVPLSEQDAQANAAIKYLRDLL
jgi:carboxyl-terminal processing protease